MGEPGLVGYWRMDEADGSRTLRDQRGKTPLTLAGTPILQSGSLVEATDPNTSATFPAQVTATGSTSTWPSMTAGWALEMLFTPSGTPAPVTGNHQDVLNTETFGVSLTEDGTSLFAWITTGSAQTTPYVIPSLVTVHVVGRYDQAASALTLWINGQQVQTFTTSGAVAAFTNFVIGVYPGGTTYVQSMEIDEVAVYTTLSNAAITRHASLVHPPAYEAPLESPSEEIVGHSYSVGQGLASPQTERATALLGAYLGTLNEYNHGVSGAALVRDNTSQLGGWPGVANTLTRTGVGPYPRYVDTGVVWYGINDASGMPGGFDATGQALYSHALRFAVSRMVSSRVFDDADTSIAYSAGWSVDTHTDFATSTRFTSRITTTGGTVTLTVPADFPGGNVAAYFMSATNKGANWTFAVDGAAYGSTVAAKPTVNIFGTANTFVYCQRFTGLSAGAHTIVLTAASVTTSASFDSWAIEAPSPSTVLVVQQMQLTTAGYANYGAPHVPTDTDVGSLNTVITNVCAEFGSYAVPVNLSSLNKDTTRMQTDNLHPNAQGHADIAVLMEAALTPPVTTANFSGTLTGAGDATGNPSTMSLMTGSADGSGAVSSSLVAQTATIGVSPTALTFSAVV
jgi:hypothetical protein